MLTKEQTTERKRNVVDQSVERILDRSTGTNSFYVMLRNKETGQVIEVDVKAANKNDALDKAKEQACRDLSFDIYDKNDLVRIEVTKLV